MFPFQIVFFGKFNINKDFMIINHILLLAKFYIYRCKLDKNEPSLDVFEAKLKATYKLELYVAICFDSFSIPLSNTLLDQHDLAAQYTTHNIFLHC